MAARVDLELGEELGVSAVVVQTAAAEHLTEGQHVVYTEGAAGRRRKHYTPEGIALLRSLLVGMGVEKAPPLSLPGLGFTVWTKKAADLAPKHVEKAPSSIHCPDAEKPASAPQGGKPVMLRMVRICPNPIWVQVETPERKTAHVRVRHSRLLTPGKKLACCLLPDGSWECADRIVSPNPAYRR